ncbi:phospholipase D regulator [Aspergillus ruber CBS 135680]|uniref:Regulator of phospholipase D SRF1 n=1 Tax=Aspergillus ruber (strain CBS 135680) TaxID=1388766 RepID=A0A017S5T0_ASPRC|nr:uncharacterized protein EURHEDRAFT_380194 [Aspergillus ruber CBS 135680]EYE92393.1 hypothetical protein EURHEDRAFT_380194 [Aspergillus ruber CBS 135680]
MAHDEHDPASQDPISREALEDQVLEEKPSAERRTGSLDESRNGPDHNAHPVDILSNDRNIDDSKNDDNHSFALSSSGLRVSENLNVEEGESTRQFGFKPRTIPAWIRSVEYEDDETDAGVTSRLLPSQPDDAIIAQHNHSPYTASRPNYNYSEQADSIYVEKSTTPRRESRWQTFSRSIAYPREEGVEEEHVTEDWLNENHADYSQPWRGELEESEDPEDPLKKKRRREIWFKRFHNTLLQSPMVPLIFRLTVWCFSLIALALGGSIQHMSSEYIHPQGPSALMAIIVDAVALVYLVYITFDEYTSKPLGLRSPSAKARLILLDIFFIVFDSANLSLAFESLSTVRGSCTFAEVNQEITPKNDAICDRQKALASVLLIALVAWLTTFAISVLRLVKRVAPA